MTQEFAPSEKEDKELFKDSSNSISSLKPEVKDENKEQNSKDNKKENNLSLKEEEKEGGDNHDISSYQEIKKEEEKSNEREETAPVFKVQKEKIKDKISFEDKTKLLAVARKLSMMDYGKIIEIMNTSDEMDGASQIFQILKTRLKEEDYKKVTEILEPYIYVKNIEKNLSMEKN